MAAAGPDVITVDRRLIRAPLQRVFACARGVERWPDWLPHYRRVRWREKRERGGIVEMAAWRPFGLFRYPTWWVSEMTVEPDVPRVRYHHLAGITRGMDVAWEFESAPEGVLVTITHWWQGPSWGPLRWPAANLVIGPIFIHGIASRTLAGIARVAEAG
jgi:ribosome-associated toxin RatA of RatAB toxin-antitoxin module